MARSRPACPDRAPQLLALAVLALLLLSAPAARAQDAMMAAFEVRYGLFHIADIAVTANEDAESYEATGRVTGAGLVRYVRDFHFDLAVQGHRSGGTYAPSLYHGDADTGRRQVQVDMRYQQGAPEILRIAPPETPGPWSISAADQTGTDDPLTALFRVIRPRPREALCGWSVDLFDGRRRARLTLDPPQTEGDSITCDGTYQRVAGYSPIELADYTALPFALVFQSDTGEDWHLTRMVTQTPYGRMRILRSP